MQRLPGVSDDEQHKRAKRSDRKVVRKRENLSTATVPDRSCATCILWRQTAEMWGECGNAIVVRQRVSGEQYPEHGIEGGTVIARGEAAWWAARTFGRAEPLLTHRTFRACSRYERQGGESPVARRGPSLLERVRQAS